MLVSWYIKIHKHQLFVNCEQKNEMLHIYKLNSRLPQIIGTKNFYQISLWFNSIFLEQTIGFRTYIIDTLLVTSI